ncbi:hypothetical protein Bca101_097468 [Brassica carinata]
MYIFLHSPWAVSRSPTCKIRGTYDERRVGVASSEDLGKYRKILLGTIPTPPQAQIVEETQALSLGNICIVDGSWTSTDQFSGIGWVWKDSMENVQLMETRNLRRREQHYTRNWKR